MSAGKEYALAGSPTRGRDSDGAVFILLPVYSETGQVSGYTHYLRVEGPRGGFGKTVAATDDVFAAASTGYVHIHARNAGDEDSWGRVRRLSPPFTAAQETFGDSLAAAKGLFAVGVPSFNASHTPATPDAEYDGPMPSCATEGTSSSGAVFLYAFNGTDPDIWVPVAAVNGTCTDNSGFGTAVAWIYEPSVDVGTSIPLGLAVSAPGEALVYIYSMDPVSYELTLTQTISAPAGALGFGQNLAVSNGAEVGDAALLMVAAPDAEVDSLPAMGSIQVYTQNIGDPLGFTFSLEILNPRPDPLRSNEGLGTTLSATSTGMVACGLFAGESSVVQSSRQGACQAWTRLTDRWSGATSLAPAEPQNGNLFGKGAMVDQSGAILIAAPGAVQTVYSELDNASGELHLFIPNAEGASSLLAPGPLFMVFALLAALVLV